MVFCLCRSRWGLRTMRASVSLRASLRDDRYLALGKVLGGGSQGGGAMRVIVMPSLSTAAMVEGTTRLCTISPQMESLFPFREPKCFLRVKASSSPWVGCSKASPALMR